MRIFSLMVIVLVMTGTYATAQTGADSYPKLAKYGKGSDFNLDKSLVDKIYNESIEEESSHEGGFRVHATPSLNLLDLQEFRTKTDYFSMDFASSLEQMPMLAFNISQELLSYHRWRWELAEEVGYGYGQGSVNGRSESDVEVKDELSLIVAPVNVQTSFSVLPFSSSKLSLSVFTGIGSTWVQQSGKLDGSSESFWVPLRENGAGLYFNFEKANIKLNVSSLSSSSDTHKIKMMRYSVGSVLNI